jgi:hypothetical protein
MLGDRQQLDVRITHVEHVRQQGVGEFKITELAIVFLGVATP